MDYILPQEPISMDAFLKRIKETERIIRQENEFIDKVRVFKPKIQLINSEKVSEKAVLDRRIKRKYKCSTPTSILRTGIMMPATHRL